MEIKSNSPMIISGTSGINNSINECISLCSNKYNEHCVSTTQVPSGEVKIINDSLDNTLDLLQGLKSLLDYINTSASNFDKIDKELNNSIAFCDFKFEPTIYESKITYVENNNISFEINDLIKQINIENNIVSGIKNNYKEEERL